MRLLKADAEGLAACAKILNSGGVAVIPTDTVYGLAAHPAFPGAVARLYSIKERARTKPIALLAADIDSVTAFGGILCAKARKLAARGWPGALTLVLPANGTCEGFRVPDSPWTRELLKATGGVLRATSANISGDAPAICAETAEKLDADVIIDGGPAQKGLASTVIKVDAAGGVEILRQGPFSP